MKPLHEAARLRAAVGARITRRLRRSGPERPALVPYLVAGAPALDTFRQTLLAVAAEADVLEVGLPFSDPVADGPVIANTGRRMLQQGVTLTWLLEALAGLGERPRAPLVLMTYLNPLLALGLPESLQALADVGVEGLIVPDLPMEECKEMLALCDERGVALIQLVAPTTPAERVERIAAVSRGFLYAVARTGITGTSTSIAQARAHLERVRAASELPVAAGFGIRSARQVTALAGVVDAAVIGTALVEAIERGEDPARFLRDLRTLPDRTNEPARTPKETPSR